MHELGHTRAIHLSVKSRQQGRFHSSGELGLRLLTKSLIYGFLCIQISLQLRNLVLHVLKQLHQLLYVSRGLGSHIEYILTARGGYCNVRRIPVYTEHQNAHRISMTLPKPNIRFST